MVLAIPSLEYSIAPSIKAALAVHPWPTNNAQTFLFPNFCNKILLALPTQMESKALTIPCLSMMGPVAMALRASPITKALLGTWFRMALMIAFFSIISNAVSATLTPSVILIWGASTELQVIRSPHNHMFQLCFLSFPQNLNERGRSCKKGYPKILRLENQTGRLGRICFTISISNKVTLRRRLPSNCWQYMVSKLRKYNYEFGLRFNAWKYDFGYIKADFSRQERCN